MAKVKGSLVADECEDVAADMSVEESADGAPRICDWDRGESAECDPWSSFAVDSGWSSDAVVVVGVRSGSAEVGRFFVWLNSGMTRRCWGNDW